MARAESMVPPLIPPFIDRTTMAVSSSRPASSARAASASSRTPRSEGTESKPHEWTIRAPLAAAASAQCASESRTNSTSPVRST